MSTLTLSGAPSFKELGLKSHILSVLEARGYTTPTPVQAQTIPLMLSRQDAIVQSQTGTGKTAAFALPILTQLDPKLQVPQALILTPTRELAQQVAASLQAYALKMPHLNVVAIYGGQDFRIQLKALEKGAQVIVGTPGRMMDHLKRGQLDFSAVNTLVLDEADEMLKMGFQEDVEWILEHVPASRQTALFSATMPPEIQKIIHRYLNNPGKVSIATKQTTVEKIKQYVMWVPPKHKFEALSRYLEVTQVDAMMIFTRTKMISNELAEKLMGLGYRAAALNGDMDQNQRDKVIKRIKSRQLDIIIATDVAARGIDVDRISHVINYDIPHDPEAYTHRIGRTGRAGREGVALTLATPHERRGVQFIERTTRATLAEFPIPTPQEIRTYRIEGLGRKVLRIIEEKDLNVQREIVENLVEAHGLDPLECAAALLRLSKNIPPEKSDGDDFMLAALKASDTPRFEKRKPQKSYGDKRRRGERRMPPGEKKFGKPRLKKR